MASEGSRRGRRQDRWVQVNARRVDEMCERIAEFEIEFSALRERLREFLRDANHTTVRSLGPFAEDLDRAQTRLQDISTGSWALRLVPIAATLEDLATHAHDLAAKLGKQIRGRVHGGDAQVERAVLDALWDPLLHLVRNAVDHGIEEPTERKGKSLEATLLLHAETVGPNVVVAVVDDGRGIDPDRVREAALARGLITSERAAQMTENECIELLFVHGFSTKAQATDLSGRGVGLDVVRGIIESLGGSVAMTSELGKGTRIAMTLPASIGKERILVLSCGPALYGIPSRNAAEVLVLQQIETVNVAGGTVVKHRDETLPLRSICSALGIDAGVDDRFVLILQQGNVRCAFSAPAILGDYELVRRPVDRMVIACADIHASAVLADGRPVFLLTVAGLLHRSDRKGPVMRRPELPSRRKPRVLIVDDSSVIRELVTEILRDGGTEPHSVPHGIAALEYLERNQPDAVVLDVDMPEMNGFEVLQQIRLRSQRIPVIMLTTRASQEDRRRASSLGADAYIVKADFEENSLVDTVRRLAGE